MWTGLQKCLKVGWRNSTYVSYLLTGRGVNAGWSDSLRPGKVQQVRFASRDSRSESRSKVGSLMSAFILFFTTLAAVTAGVLAAYAAVIGILCASAHISRPASLETQVFVPTEASAGGD